MLFLGDGCCLPAYISNDTKIYRLLYLDGRCISGLAHTALHFGSADGMLQVSKMRQQFLHAELDSFFPRQVLPLRTSN